MYYDLKNKKYIESKDSKSLRILYNTFLGRCILKILCTKFVANLCAKYMNSRLSKLRVKRFIKNNNIDMSLYVNKKYLSFNDFFVRKIKADKRPIADGLISVCDSKLSAYKIQNNSFFQIKNSIYTIEELIQDKANFKYALVFRLGVDDYHHYIFPDDGKVLRKKHINGKLHTVQPIALKKYKVFCENDREVTYLQCPKLGLVCYIEVGAMIVGKIVNEKINRFNKGDEKGHFEFGGSTVIMLLEKDVKVNKIILDNTQNGIETIVKMGEKIGDY